MTTKERAIQITKENLLLVFGETSAPKRLEKIGELYVPSSEVFLADPMGVSKTHQGISDIVAKIHAESPGNVVSEIGDVNVLKEDVETDTWVTRLKWGFGPTGGEYVLIGEDVVTIVGGKIKAMYAFLDEK